VTAAGPIGFAALLARMPRRFASQARAVEKHARQRRAAQARLLETAPHRGGEPRSNSRDEWHDTVADFNAR
jgi:hypothetical protein